MSRRFLALLLIAVAPAVLASCGGDRNAAAGSSAGAAGAAGAGAAGGKAAGKDGHGEGSRSNGAESLPPRKVRLVAAEMAPLSRTVQVSGTLAADEQAELSLKLAGRLAQIAADLGDRVRKGQILARISPVDYQLKVRQAESALVQARVRLGLPPQGATRVVDPSETAPVRQAEANRKQAQLQRDRAARLFEQQLLSQSDMDNADAALQVADARYQDAVEDARGRQGLLSQRLSELDIARQQLADTALPAPFDGVIRERRAAVGDYVPAGQTVFVLVRVHPLRLRLAIPEREATEIRVGQPVQLTVEGAPGEHTGRVARMSPAISEDNRTLLIEAEVPNRDGVLRPGSFARAEIVTRSDVPTVLVPASSIVAFAGIEKVMSVEDGHAVEKRVKTGRRAGDRVEILEGATAGERVVVEPGNLVEGQRVTVLP
jgi:RND family efflux transporter MFP subunit